MLPSLVHADSIRVSAFMLKNLSLDAIEYSEIMIWFIVRDLFKALVFFKNSIWSMVSCVLEHDELSIFPTSTRLL